VRKVFSAAAIWARAPALEMIMSTATIDVWI
jgi:hypothetical protein